AKPGTVRESRPMHGYDLAVCVEDGTAARSAHRDAVELNEIGGDLAEDSRRHRRADHSRQRVVERQTGSVRKPDECRRRALIRRIALPIDLLHVRSAIVWDLNDREIRLAAQRHDSDARGQIET